MDHNPPHELVIITANANGASGYTNMRKIALKDIINKFSPAIVLFQELLGKPSSWLYKRDSIVPAIPGIHRRYRLVRENGKIKRAIMHHMDYFNLNNSMGSLLDLMRRLSITDKEASQLASRMCLRLLYRIPMTSIFIICWHGEKRKGTLKNKIKWFKGLIEFVRRLQSEYKLPILLGGDFNVNFTDICQYIQDPFLIYEYAPSSRRREAGVKDYFITTSDLHLFDMQFIATEGVYIFRGVQYQMMSTFDHDPIFARLEYVEASTNVHNGRIHREEECTICHSRRLHREGRCEECAECHIMRLGVLYDMVRDGQLPHF